MPPTIPELLALVQSARLELYEASSERRRLSLAPMRKPPLVEAANDRVADARSVLEAARTTARIAIYGA